MYTVLPRSFLPLEIFAVATVIFFAGLWIMSMITRDQGKHH
jgi:ABC-type amino acid transport system permease subunit